MTFDEMVMLLNDPRRTPMGLFGPIHSPRAYYAIGVDRRPASARTLLPAPRALPDSPAEFRQQPARATRRAAPGSAEEFRQKLEAAEARGRLAPQRPLDARPPLRRPVTCRRCFVAGFRESADRYRCRGCGALLDHRGAVV